MNILKTIFGSGNVVQEGFKLIDSFHTSETELLETKTDSKAKLLNAYAPFKIAQRVLAAMFAVTFLICFFLSLIMTLGGWGDVSEIKPLMDEFYVAEIMVTIVGFYFGGGFLEGTIAAVRRPTETK